MSDRPRFRPDLVLVEQTYRGEQSFIVKDPTTHKYFRFRPVEIAVMQTLDGERTVAEAALELAEQGLRVSAAAVGKFADKLKSMGLMERTLRERSTLLLERLRAERRRRLRPPLFQGELLRMRWSIGDPDQFLDRTMPYVRFCFTRGFLLASVALFGVYCAVLAARWSDFSAALADLYQFRVGLGGLAVLYLTGLVVIAIHELGHAYTCKYFGGKVHEMGAMLIYFEPAFFCNVNDAWTFPELRARLWVTAAGSWIQMVVASLAAIVWWAAAPGTLLSEVALAAVVIGGFTTVLMNVNPLIPLDGYYALSDWLEVPNLRQRAFTHLSWLIKAKVLRLDVPAPPADEREQRIFTIYSLLAAVYICSIFLFIGAAVYGWIGRALGALGGILFAVLVWRMAGEPIREWSRTILAAARQAKARLPSGRRGRVLAVAACLALLGVLVPARITVTGPFTVAPSSSVALVAADSGLVFDLAAREGLVAEQGTQLARLRNLDLERTIAIGARTVDSLAIRETIGARPRSGRRGGPAGGGGTGGKCSPGRVPEPHGIVGTPGAGPGTRHDPPAGGARGTLDGARRHRPAARRSGPGGGPNRRPRGGNGHGPARPPGPVGGACRSRAPARGRHRGGLRIRGRLGRVSGEPGPAHRGRRPSAGDDGGGQHHPPPLQRVGCLLVGAAPPGPNRSASVSACATGESSQPLGYPSPGLGHAEGHAGAGPPAFQGRYEVEREIGKGGNARIYLAGGPTAARSHSRSCIRSSWSASRPTGSSGRSASASPAQTTRISPICSIPGSGNGWSTTS